MSRGVEICFIDGAMLRFEDVVDHAYVHKIHPESDRRPGNASRWYTIDYTRPPTATESGFLGGAAAAAPTSEIIFEVLEGYYDAHAGYPHTRRVFASPASQVKYAREFNETDK